MSVERELLPNQHRCSLAVTLALQIRQAMAEVEGVTGQEIEAVGYMGAESLNELLKES